MADEQIRELLKKDLSREELNEQIRELLKKDLSREELKTIAEQRCISTVKYTKEEIRQRILNNLARQESYSILRK